MLQEGATKSRARKTAKQSSLLCGKIYYEIGDRLTPSHSRTKAGVRLRYYVSHRLIKNSGSPNRDGWRLPAIELETKVTSVIVKRFNSTSFIGTLIPDATAAEIAKAKAKIDAIGNEARVWLDFIDRIDLKAGELSIRLDQNQIAMFFKRDSDGLKQDALNIKAPFQIRKRGVETKLIFADAPSPRDETLIKNIAKAHHWFEQIKAGKTFSQIAASDKTSKRRIQQMIELAFLAPDIIRDVMDGAQPFGFTSDWCLRHAIPVNWAEQRALIATL
jgi:site-specific DNA recombinase